MISKKKKTNKKAKTIKPKIKTTFKENKKDIDVYKGKELVGYIIAPFKLKNGINVPGWAFHYKSGALVDSFGTKEEAIKYCETKI